MELAELEPAHGPRSRMLDIYNSAMLNGESAHIIVYDTMRTDAEIEQTEAYLRTRYAHY